MDSLLLSIESGIGTITLNRPQQRNAISFDMWQRVSDLCKQVEQDEAAQILVVRGAGDEAFSAGGDIEEFEERRSDPWQAQIYNGKVEMALKRLARLPKPTIALIKGYCVGGGCMLAAHCDIRIAADNARIGMPVARLGTLVGYGELERMMQLIGVAATLDLLLTARTIDAVEARRIHFCTQIYSLAEIEEEVYGLARTMAGLAPLSQRWHKQMVQTLLRKPDLLDLKPEEAMLPDACYDTHDYAEGIRAFLEKRPPRFTGK